MKWMDPTKYGAHSVVTDFKLENGFIVKCLRVQGGGNSNDAEMDGDVVMSERKESEGNANVKMEDDTDDVERTLMMRISTRG